MGYPLSLEFRFLLPRGILHGFHLRGILVLGTQHRRHGQPHAAAGGAALGRGAYQSVVGGWWKEGPGVKIVVLSKKTLLRFEGFNLSFRHIQMLDVHANHTQDG